MQEPSDKMNELSHEVIGAAIEVHRLLGPGYLESVYEYALMRECELRGIPVVRQAPVGVVYKGVAVGEGQLDLLVDGCLVVELKAVETLLPIHTAQLMSYLKATQLPLGLLINFNVTVLKSGINRVVYTAKQHPAGK